MVKIEILGVKIDNVTFIESLKRIDDFVISKKPRQIVTVNPEFVMSAQKDSEFMNILNNADLSIADGSGLLFVSKCFLGKSIKEKITGIDLMWALAKLAEKRKYPIFLLGAGPGIAEKAALNLKNKFPKLLICGTFAGKPQINQVNYKNNRSFKMTDIKPAINDSNTEIINKIHHSKPKILFVAYGAPKQDKFIARYKKILNVPVMIGVGGAFDFISGKTKRAPIWITKIWLEWLWRLFHEPWRLQRIITAAFSFPIAVIKSKIVKNVK